MSTTPPPFHPGQGGMQFVERGQAPNSASTPTETYRELPQRDLPVYVGAVPNSNKSLAGSWGMIRRGRPSKPFFFPAAWYCGPLPWPTHAVLLSRFWPSHQVRSICLALSENPASPSPLSLSLSRFLANGSRGKKKKDCRSSPLPSWNISPPSFSSLSLFPSTFLSSLSLSSPSLSFSLFLPPPLSSSPSRSLSP